MNSPSSDHLYVPKGNNGGEVGRARELLQLSLSESPRPIDELLHRLEHPDGPDWLIEAISTQIDPAQLSSLLNGNLPLETMIELKDQTKTTISEAETKEAAIVALAIYCLCVASAVVHYNRLISTQKWRTWQQFLADFADLAPDPWRPLLFDAAVKVEHARAYSE